MVDFNDLLDHSKAGKSYHEEQKKKIARIDRAAKLTWRYAWIGATMVVVACYQLVGWELTLLTLGILIIILGFIGAILVASERDELR